MSVMTVDWPVAANIHAYCTTRVGGFGRSPYDSFNLAEHVDDQPAAVSANRQKLHDLLALPRAPLWLNQTHSSNVIELDANSPLSVVPDADASWTRLSNLPLAVLTADCLPILLSSRCGSVVAAIHAGWRGLACGVVANTVARMPVSAESVLAWLGPAIGADHFEVGAEVRQAFRSRHQQFETGFRPSTEKPDKYFADLFALARTELCLVGVDQVYGGGVCTVDHPQQFFSYRRDGGVTGRQAVVIWRSLGD